MQLMISKKLMKYLQLGECDENTKVLLLHLQTPESIPYILWPPILRQ